MHRKVTLELGRKWGRTSLWLLAKICDLKVEYRGLENIPAGPLIVACKHQSVWETMVLPIKFDDYSYILKKELIFVPLLGWYFLAAEQIAIDRSKGARILRQISTKVKLLFAQGRQLFIFPEGTRRPAGAPAAYKRGIVHLYCDTGAHVMPVALNSGVFWPRRSFIIRPGTVVINFLPVIAPGLGAQEFFDKLKNSIEEASDGLIAEAVAQDHSLATVVEQNRRLREKEYNV